MKKTSGYAIVLIVLICCFSVGIYAALLENEQNNTYDEQVTVKGKIIDVLFLYREPPIYPVTKVIFEDGTVVNFDYPTYTESYEKIKPFEDKNVTLVYEISLNKNNHRVVSIEENIQFEHVPETDNVTTYTDVTFLRDENEHNDYFEKQLQKDVEKIHKELNRLSLLKKDFERYIKV